MPEWNEQIRKQLAELHLAPAREAEIVEELAQHAEDRYREIQSGGATEAEACRVALDEITGRELLARELQMRRSLSSWARKAKGIRWPAWGRTFATDSERCGKAPASPPSRCWRWRWASGQTRLFSAW
jgi:hypothetical protein